MKRCVKMLAAAVSAVMLFPVCAVPAHAEGSIEDVCDAIREIGYPEECVKTFMNEYETRPHDENGMYVGEDYWEYIDLAENIIIFRDLIDGKLAAFMGVSPEAVKTADPSAFVSLLPLLTNAAPAATTAPAAAVTDENGQTVSQTTVTTVSGSEAPVTTAVTNGGTHTKEQEAAFVNMTLEEKQAFISSLPEDQRAAYFAGLTPAERKSLLKQISKDAQADILKDFVEAGETFGMHVSIDKIGDGQIDFSVRDSDGTLIDSTSFGSKVDDTGWDMTLPVIGSAGTILLSIGGFGWTAYRANKRREEVLNGEN
ncbi:MAG: hypothetical protein IK130_10600 [Oscillospiraceae bacterium]|nr:hypothetical protein [Oscillospiraceae bacterium]